MPPIPATASAGSWAAAVEDGGAGPVAWIANHRCTGDGHDGSCLAMGISVFVITCVLIGLCAYFYYRTLERHTPVNAHPRRVHGAGVRSTVEDTTPASIAGYSVGAIRLGIGPNEYF